MNKIRIQKIVEEIAVAWATFFYVGRSPKAPGTLGSLAALPLAWWIWSLPSAYSWALTSFIFISGTLGAQFVIARTGETDHQSIVIDEVVGILITTSVAGTDWKNFLLGFFLFRLFDIWKPWPISWVDRRWKSALGTMVDDLLAALLAALTLYLLSWIFLSHP